MNNLRWPLTTICLALFFPGMTTAAEPEWIPLWPHGVPGAVGTDAIDRPELLIYPADPQAANGAAVVILPGGGYGALAIDHEGHQIARWFNSFGVTGIVVKYRLGPRYRHPAPLQDAQRAVRYTRANAQPLRIDPQRIGIMGFSAGGHLASTVSTHFDDGDADSADPVARQNSRPDFSILCYPVISFQSPFTHRGSARNLLGENPDPQLLRSLSNETQVSEQTPPTFLFHTGEDTGVPVENSLVYYQALRKHGVPAELHVYQQGPHGVGLAPGHPALSTWKDRLADWMRVNGFLSPAVKRAAVSGNVTVDGEPMRRGTIAFHSTDSPTAPVAWGIISRGSYRLNEQQGPIPGQVRIIVNSLDAAPQSGEARAITKSHAELLGMIHSDMPNVLDLSFDAER